MLQGFGLLLKIRIILMAGQTDRVERRNGGIHG